MVASYSLRKEGVIRARATSMSFARVLWSYDSVRWVRSAAATSTWVRASSPTREPLGATADDPLLRAPPGHADARRGEEDEHGQHQRQPRQHERPDVLEGSGRPRRQERAGFSTARLGRRRWSRSALGLGLAARASGSGSVIDHRGHVRVAEPAPGGGGLDGLRAVGADAFVALQLRHRLSPRTRAGRPASGLPSLAMVSLIRQDRSSTSPFGALVPHLAARRHEDGRGVGVDLAQPDLVDAALRERLLAGRGVLQGLQGRLVLLLERRRWRRRAPARSAGPSWCGRSSGTPASPHAPHV